jgi:hypothetical protein
LPGEWFPSLCHLQIIPLGTVSVPGLHIIKCLLIFNKEKKVKEKERKKWRTKEINRER